jgi:hypothetical protein
VGEFLLFGFKLESGALAGEGFTNALAGLVTPIGVEPSIFFKHFAVSYEVRCSLRPLAGWSPLDTWPDA